MCHQTLAKFCAYEVYRVVFVMIEKETGRERERESKKEAGEKGCESEKNTKKYACVYLL